MKLSIATCLLLVTETYAFQSNSGSVQRSSSYGLQELTMALHAAKPTVEESTSRRSFSYSLMKAAGLGVGFLLSPENAFAGIDVSGLQVEGGGGGNANLAQQLKAYDGSGTARVKEVKALETTTTAPKRTEKPLDQTALDSKVAHWAYRANPGFGPSLKKAGPLGNLYRLNDVVVPPTGSKLRSVGVQFEFPFDWLQLDKFTGGIQYVDQRNGDKLYLLQATLPPDTSLASLSKSVLGDLIFDPEGSVSKTGQTIEDYKVVNGQTLVECPAGSCATRRRFKIKYATVTGNGLRVERRGLVDAYQVENEIYMLMTSSNAVKFEKGGSERETVENIVNSFVLDI
ncbi:unnamed protein product [Cylindrotheca closterium]|uniref:PsbP C-terminal domain-containing protein n=1 Tax=Cylindrotheca closterium TaxID=2856 RepID=A0AAD2CE27_9STRA|nr:unnamed protein product [Cylindrotheca closterium]